MLVSTFFVYSILNLAGSLQALNTLWKYQSLEGGYWGIWIIYLIRCGKAEESVWLRSIIQQLGKENTTRLRRLSRWLRPSMFTCGKQDRKGPPEVYANAVDVFQLWIHFSFSAKNVFCAHTIVQSWDIFLNVLLHPNDSVVGVGGQFLLSLFCGVTCNSMKRSWDVGLSALVKIVRNLLAYPFFFFFPNQKIPLCFNTAAQKIFGKKYFKMPENFCFLPLKNMKSLLPHFKM